MICANIFASIPTNAHSSVNIVDNVFVKVVALKIISLHNMALPKRSPVTIAIKHFRSKNDYVFICGYIQARSRINVKFALNDLHVAVRLVFKTTKYFDSYVFTTVGDKRVVPKGHQLHHTLRMRERKYVITRVQLFVTDCMTVRKTFALINKITTSQRFSNKSIRFFVCFQCRRKKTYLSTSSISNFFFCTFRLICENRTLA